MRQLFYFILLTIALSACDREFDHYQESDTQTNLVVLDTNFIDKREALALASMIEFPYKLDDGTTTKSTTYLEVETLTAVGDTEKPTYYIANYKDDLGFAILAADKRAELILAYSIDGNFPLHEEELPRGLTEWMESIGDYIDRIRIANIQTKSNLICEALKSAIINSDKDATKRIDTGCYPSNKPPVDCNSTSIRGPLLTTVWGQRNGYNDFVKKECDTGKAPTGCVATAMAQIMKYHRHPSRYDWNQMSDFLSTTETARLMADAGASVGMNYGCKESGAETRDVPNALKMVFQYSSAQYGSYNLATVKSEINSGRPIILRGTDKNGAGGHAWVCDGYKTVNACTYSYSYLHMNWGWEDSSLNTWYFIDQWNVLQYSFYKDAGMVYNIKP